MSTAGLAPSVLRRHRDHSHLWLKRTSGSRPLFRVRRRACESAVVTPWSPALDSSPSMYRFLRLRGHRVAYRAYGDPNGEPVVLLHAFASQSGSWSHTAEALAQQGFRVIAPDLRGHGRSDWTPTYSLADFEDDLSDLLDALGLGAINLIGHSLGGHLALKLATHQPERIRRLVIEAAPVPPRDVADATALAAAQAGPAWQRSLRLLGLGRLLRLMLLRQFDLRAARTVLPELRAPMPAWWSRLSTLRAPCLLLASHDDGFVSSRLPLLAAQIPHAVTRRFGSGHRLHGEHTAAFLAEVIPFVTPPVYAE